MAKAQHPRADRSALANLILKLAGEVRQQVGLQLAISHTLLEPEGGEGIPGDRLERQTRKLQQTA